MNRLDLQAIRIKAEAEAEAHSRLMYPEGKEREECRKELAQRYYMEMISPFPRRVLLPFPARTFGP